LEFKIIRTTVTRSLGSIYKSVADTKKDSKSTEFASCRRSSSPVSKCWKGLQCYPWTRYYCGLPAFYIKSL
jgi:hypothetical protein